VVIAIGEGAGIVVGRLWGGGGGGEVVCWGWVVCGWRDWDEKLFCWGKGGCNGVVRGGGWWSSVKSLG